MDTQSWWPTRRGEGGLKAIWTLSKLNQIFFRDWFPYSKDHNNYYTLTPFMFTQTMRTMILYSVFDCTLKPVIPNLEISVENSEVQYRAVHAVGGWNNLVNNFFEFFSAY